MKSYYLLSLSIIFLFACSGLRPMLYTGGGLEGYIYLVRGNQMPSPGRPHGPGRGVRRQICIYEPTKITETEGAMPMFTSIKTRLITTIKSDSTGHFNVKLPPGSYSVFIKDGVNYFAAETNGTGILNPVDIGLKTITKRNFTINNNAAF